MGMSEEDRQIIAFDRVLQITRDMVATTDLDELLGVILDSSMKLLSAERATLFLYEGETEEFVSRIAHGSEEIRFPASAGIAGAAAAGGEVLNIPDAYADKRFNPEVDRKTGFRTRNILAVPLRDHDDELVGVLEVLNKPGGPFTPEDVTLAETLGAQAGVVLQRARLMAHYVEKQRMAQALSIARTIQRDQLPKGEPCIAGFDVSGATWPADETGGDVFDWLDLGDGRLTVMLADATGHGIGPALIIVEARAMVRALSGQCAAGGGHGAPLDIPAILGRVNDMLAYDLDDMRFVTCFLGLVDGPAGAVRWASAGQGPVIFYDRQADAFEEVPATGVPLGVMEGYSFDAQEERTMAPGDILTLVTDGFFEARDASGEDFGTSRLGEVIRASRDRSAAEIIAAMYAAVDEFTAGAPQADDLTAVVVRRLEC